MQQWSLTSNTLRLESMVTVISWWDELSGYLLQITPLSVHSISNQMRYGFREFLPIKPSGPADQWGDQVVLLLLADAVLYGIVGATCNKAASTVVRMVLKFELKTGVGFRRSIMWPSNALCL